MFGIKRAINALLFINGKKYTRKHYNHIMKKRGFRLKNINFSRITFQYLRFNRFLFKKKIAYWEKKSASPGFELGMLDL